MRRSTLHNFHVNSVGKQMHAWLPAWIRDACDTNGVTRFFKIERLIIKASRLRQTANVNLYHVTNFSP